MTAGRPGAYSSEPRPPDAFEPTDSPITETLARIQRRVLWLAVRMVDYANHERPKEDALKVGGHQASSASMVSLMTALYFHDLRANDRVSVKPHASPVLHAIEYLLGRLDRSYLTRLRDLGGLQSYPSRTKDPFPVDYSTGSVGLGSAAPIFGALADRYVQSHFGTGTGGRYISLIGDAELDEGNIWEALGDPLVRTLHNVLWIVDLNRQSLDRVVPGIRALEFERQFDTLGWHVLELKYGRRLRTAFELPGGDVLRRRIDEMPNEEYHGLFGASDEAMRVVLLDGLSNGERTRLDALLAKHTGSLGRLIHDLGGHDLGDVLEAFALARAETRRPTVIFAYTIKGFGLEIAGRPMNHSALLTSEQIDRLRAECSLDVDQEWERFAPDSAEGQICHAAAARLERPPSAPNVQLTIPPTLTDREGPPTATQAAFGRILLDLSRREEVGRRLVTISPDVSVSTSLGGWINKVGTWGPEDQPMYDEMADSALRWRVHTRGQHIELGIAEMNLVLLLGQLGLTWDYQREPLLPIGTLYDPFVMRALEGIVYSVYSGSRFILAGTPSGISLSREGGAHQSTITPGIGIQTPKLSYVEPCYARELEWLLLDALARLHAPDGEALYLRLSTTPIDQTAFADAVVRYGEDQLRADVLAGGFRIRDARPADDIVVIAACGTMVPQALAAADMLADDEGVEATVLCLSSPDRLYRDWRDQRLLPVAKGRLPDRPSHLETLAEPRAPLVTVIDGASHSLAWIGSALGVRMIPLGVDAFGQAGSQPALYDEHHVSADAIVTAALAALEPTP
jgi:pyruvate dehydrogenase E1 component